MTTNAVIATSMCYIASVAIVIVFLATSASTAMAMNSSSASAGWWRRRTTTATPAKMSDDAKQPVTRSISTDVGGLGYDPSFQGLPSASLTDGRPISNEYYNNGDDGVDDKDDKALEFFWLNLEVCRRTSTAIRLMM